MKFRNCLSKSMLMLRPAKAVSAIAVLCALILQPAWLNGQQNEEPTYKVMPLQDRFDVPNPLDADPTNDIELRRIRSEMSSKNEVIRDLEGRIRDSFRNQGSVNQQEFEEFFREYFFANMTQTTPRKLAEYSEMRNKFFRNFMSQASGSNRQQLVTLTFNTMSAIATENYHPAARVNALLMIGRLDSRRGDRSAGGAAPTPYEPAMNFLLDFVEDANNEDHLKITAMVGILRHAQLRPVGSSNPLTGTVRARLSALAQTWMQAPVDGFAKKDGKYWMRRQGVQLIGNMRDPGSNAGNAVELAKLVADENEQFYIRLDAVEAIGKLNNLNAGQLDLVDVSKSIGKFVSSQAETDARFIEETVRSIYEVARFLDEEDPLKGSTKKKEDDGPGEVGMSQMFDDNEGSGRAGADGENVKEVLPVFKRTEVRQRVKTVTHLARFALGHENPNGGLLNLVKQANGDQSDEAQFVQRLIDRCNLLMSSTDVVETRRSRRNDNEEPDSRTRAEKLRDALDAGSEAINDLIKTIEPEAPAETEDASAVEGSADQGSGQNN